jgi:hypothetical protein
MSAICGCHDQNCEASHLGQCDNEGTERLYRVDMYDNEGTLFCEDCADDAVDSGIFSPFSREDEEYYDDFPANNDEEYAAIW